MSFDSFLNHIGNYEGTFIGDLYCHPMANLRKLSTCHFLIVL